MCGIAGLVLKNPQDSQGQSWVRSMLGRLERRGPDDAGVYQAGAACLGHRRLAIIDLSSQGHQPMVREALSLVFNGTIYNYLALRQELQQLGYRFHSTSDTEVILLGFAHWGEAVVHKLDGMFAFAIWNEQTQSLFMARDRLGIKPFYYAMFAGGFAFASNTQALLQLPGINTDLDPEALHFQFSLHGVVPAPKTLFQGIKKLPPAYQAWWKNGVFSMRGYWELSAQRPVQQWTEQDWQDKITQGLKQAVNKRRLAADVPVGVLLSGGLDSSLLVALLREVGQQELHTFSIGFEDAPEEAGSEFFYSDQVVAQYQTQHRKILIPNSQVLPRLPEAFAQMAEPMFAQDAVAFYLLSQVVSQEIKVVLSGQGADEVFGGYFWYPQMAQSGHKGVAGFAPYYVDRDHSEYLDMMSPAYHCADVTSAWLEQKLTRPGADTHLDQVFRLDATALIVDDPVKRVDNMTMAWGLEARVPFLDIPLVETAMQMPPELKLALGGKGILKQISRGRIPDDVIDRPKGYFPMPALKYIRGEYLTMIKDRLLSPEAKSRSLYQTAYVEKLLKQPESHFTRIQGSKLWHLAALEIWLQINLDKH